MKTWDEFCRQHWFKVTRLWSGAVIEINQPDYNAIVAEAKAEWRKEYRENGVCCCACKVSEDEETILAPCATHSKWRSDAREKALREAATEALHSGSSAYSHRRILALIDKETKE